MYYELHCVSGQRSARSALQVDSRIVVARRQFPLKIGDSLLEILALGLQTNFFVLQGVLRGLGGQVVPYCDGPGYSRKLKKGAEHHYTDDQKDD